MSRPEKIEFCGFSINMSQLRVTGTSIYKHGVIVTSTLGYFVGFMHAIDVTRKNKGWSRTPQAFGIGIAYGTVLGAPVAVTWPVSVPMLAFLKTRS
jgi:hypothetical protein